MDDFENDFLHAQWIARNVALYDEIRKVLGSLELPIQMVEFDRENGSAGYDSAKLALEAVRDLPMPRLLRAAITTALIDWLSSVALSIHATIQGETWALRAAILQLGRCENTIHLARGVLSGELPGDIPDSDEE